MEIEKAFGLILKNQRIKLGISQEELAHRCGLDRTFISLLERGKRKPTLNTVFIISSKLDIKPRDFIKKVEEMLSEERR